MTLPTITGGKIMTTKELIEKAKECKNVEDILALAKAEKVELCEEKAKEIFAQCHVEGELSDDELDAVAGGAGSTRAPKGIHDSMTT